MLHTSAVGVQILFPILGLIVFFIDIFTPLTAFFYFQERVIGTCLENKIAVYSPHTSFDAVSGGVNDWLAGAFGMLC
jgi:putative NIF3 family GTP cyclohydrolase 1 type 2